MKMTMAMIQIHVVGMRQAYSSQIHNGETAMLSSRNVFVCLTLCNLHCALCIVHCEPARNVHIAPCVKWPPCSLKTVHIVQCTLYKITNVQCVLWHMHCALCRVQRAALMHWEKSLNGFHAYLILLLYAFLDICIPLTIPSYLLWLRLRDFIQPKNCEILD